MTTGAKRKTGLGFIITGFALIIAAGISFLLNPQPEYAQYAGPLIIAGVIGFVLIIIGFIIG